MTVVARVSVGSAVGRVVRVDGRGGGSPCCARLGESGWTGVGGLFLVLASPFPRGREAQERCRETHENPRAREYYILYEDFRFSPICLFNILRIIMYY